MQQLNEIRQQGGGHSTGGSEAMVRPATANPPRRRLTATTAPGSGAPELSEVARRPDEDAIARNVAMLRHQRLVREQIRVLV
jgi:hypothetical protein